MKITKIDRITPKFDDIKAWYDKHLHPDANAYDDPNVFRHVYHEGRFAAIFQATSRGAQKLFMQAKPNSITDIAAITSIYRPGPLAANVDKIYLDAKNHGKKFDWGHPLFDQVLGNTYNCLIFQESVMDLVEVVGGFPKEKCDDIRRAIMKRDMSKSEAAVKASQDMENEFVRGALERNVPEDIARKAYKNILWFSGYGFNKSHATAYAIDSYLCAWLLTYYPEQWLTSYLESHSGDPDSKAEAFAEVKKMGYKIVPIDINFATARWSAMPNKEFMPSLLSCKGVGQSAIDELLEHRPYSSIEDMLWNADGSWRPSKFNKRALEALIKIKALKSLNVVGPDSLFMTWKQLHHVVIERQDQIRKTSKRDPYIGKKRFFELINETKSMEEWTNKEYAQNMVDVFGTIDVNLLIDSTVLESLQTNKIDSIDGLEEGQKDMVWFVFVGGQVKKTARGRTYLLASVMGPTGKIYRLNIWGYDGGLIPQYSLYAAEVEKNDYGCSTNLHKIKMIA